MKYTFGKTIASQKLEELLSNNPSARKKISTLLSQFTKQMLNVIDINKNPETVHLCLELLKNYTLNRVDIKKNLTKDIRTYTKNVIVSRYRVYCRNFDEIISFIKEKDKNKFLTSTQKGVL